MVTNRPQRRATTSNGAGFHNPYNFVPAFPRQGDLGELGDRSPSGHDCYLDDHWSGRITVKLKTITPLLIPDAAKSETLRGKDHATYPLRLIGNKPYLPPTSIKGMLRSAYEAVTNSRLSIFSNHDGKLAYRMEPNPRICPALVARRKADGRLVFRVMKVAKLLCYKKYEEGAIAPLDKGASEVARQQGYPSGQIPEHGDLLWVRLDSKNPFKVSQFQLRDPGDRPKNGWHKGRACITGPNCNEKRYERVFLETEESRVLEANQSEIELWEQLIKDYQALHKDELKERQNNRQNFDAYLGHEPGKTGWSQHIYTKGAAKLKPGTLCYIQTNKQNQVTAVLPVTVSRQLFKLSPEDLLPDSLRPSTHINSLSPADRVFGWVNQEGSGAYRGQLRIHSVNCVSNDAIAYFTQPEEDPQANPGVPLAILGQPKPQQVRFYLSQNSSDRKNKGEPLSKGTPKQNGYQNSHGLRGRKVYPHHRLLELNKATGYWEAPGDNPEIEYQNGVYREYRRPPGEKQRDSQNRSIQAWVKPGTEFEFEIDVLNLSNEELGALLWLLQLEEGCHRLGGAKPLGFGSVQLSISYNDLRKGQEWDNYYRSLSSIDKPTQEEAIECVQKFEQAIAQAYGYETAEDIPFIKAFLQAARGFEDDLPIHYPRTEAAPNANGEGFEWFMNNERGSKRSLPPLWNETGLPHNP